MKPTILLVAAVLVIGAFLWFRQASPRSAPTGPETSNVSIVDGRQIVTIRAKGGYQPALSAAKAGIPTILRFETSATYDCSSAIRIPSLGIEKTLPPAGATDIAIGALQPGRLQGTCGMGMYRFALDVQG